MGWFDSHQDSYDQYNTDGDHHASLGHELLSGAVTYEAAKAYEDHCAKNGNPSSHAKATEIFSGFAGAAADRLIETRGMDAYDQYRDRSVQQAQQNFDQYSSNYDYSSQQQTNSCGGGGYQQTDYSQSDSYQSNNQYGGNY